MNRPSKNASRRALNRLLKRRSSATHGEPSPAPDPPTHLPHQAPANFALPEKRRKGDNR